MFKKIITKIKSSVLYQILFVCDYGLIPTKNKKSLIERCSYNPKDDQMYIKREPLGIRFL